MPTVKQIVTVDINNTQKPQPTKTRDTLPKKTTTVDNKDDKKVVPGIELDADYQKKLEEQKRKREEILKMKEERRKEIALKKSAAVT